jgi:hypothetical protein
MIAMIVFRWKNIRYGMFFFFSFYSGLSSFSILNINYLMQEGERRGEERRGKENKGEERRTEERRDSTNTQT